jgi:DNA-binding NarL/FixJ family response regulator
MCAALVPDAVVLDLQLVDGSALAALPALKRRTPSPRVVVLSNAPRSGYQERCRALGADCFLDKSSEFDLVADVLRGLVATRS